MEENKPPEGQPPIPPEQQPDMPPEQQPGTPPEQQPGSPPEQEPGSPPEQQPDVPAEPLPIPPEQDPTVVPEQEPGSPPEQTPPQEHQAYVPPAKPAAVPPVAAPASLTASSLNLQPFKDALDKARMEIHKYIIGQDQMVELILVGIFSNGHILLEGVPGIAKTLTAKIIARTMNVDFSRIQFTPDLMPSDVIGTSVFDMKDSKFTFNKGPVFSNIVLIDEINRAPAKTQAALFEVMEERQITYDGTTYPMSFPFLVLATQNPVEQEGTYRLPEAQLDRFLFRVKIGYPSLEEEQQIIHRFKDNIGSPDLSIIQPVFTAEQVQEFQELVEKVKIEDQLVKYIAEMVHQTRSHGKLYLGASPRASLSIMRTAKAMAAMRGRDFITPDDVQFVALHVMNHRVILTPEAEMEGLTPETVLDEIIKKIEVPR